MVLGFALGGGVYGRPGVDMHSRIQEDASSVVVFDRTFGLLLEYSAGLLWNQDDGPHARELHRQ